MKVRVVQKVQSHFPDLLLLGAVVVLVLFGLLMIYNASPVTSARDFGDPTHLAVRQVIWAVGGIVPTFIIYKLNYKIWEKLAPLLMLVGILLLVAVLIPGVGSNIYGAQRWIGIGNLFAIQPAEFVKLAYIIYLAAFLSKKNKVLAFHYFDRTFDRCVASAKRFRNCHHN